MKLRTRKRKAFTRQTREVALRAFMKDVARALERALPSCGWRPPGMRRFDAGQTVSVWKPKPYVVDAMSPDDARAYFRGRLAENGIGGA